jgi:SAM-dependent methyltransferase
VNSSSSEPEFRSRNQQVDLAQAAVKNWGEYWESIKPEFKKKKEHGKIAALKRFWQGASAVELNDRIISRELLDAQVEWILEPGCGSGGTSQRLADRGYKMVLLDSSPAAINLAKSDLGDRFNTTYFVLASIYYLPFKDEVFDFEFNIGVLDHLGPRYRTAALREMHRCAKPHSRLAIIVNSVYAFIHLRAMRHATKQGIWRFGYKEALRSLSSEVSQIERAEIVRESFRGFLSQFEFLRYYLPQKRWCQHLFYWIFFSITWPFAWLNLLPGQYTISVIEKRNQPGTQNA